MLFLPRKDKSISFMVFFFVFGFQILANAFLAIGVQGSGGGCAASDIYRPSVSFSPTIVMQ
jgi:hypothetical protein